MKVVISEVAPHIDGEYALPAPFTNDELHQIKLESGVLPTGLLDALIGGDAAFACSVGAIVCQRAGKRINHRLLMEHDAGCIHFMIEDPVEDDDPPTAPGKPGSKKKRSGKPSPRSSASPAAGPQVSGDLT